MNDKSYINPTTEDTPETALAAEKQQAEDLRTTVKPIGEKEIGELFEVLNIYKAGKASVDRRIVASEQWWKLRNTQMEAEEGHGKDGFNSSSAWLHNVITSKHADGMDAYPEPNFLPREENDKAEAAILSKVVPCILEQNKFEKTYSNALWSKDKTGTAVFKIVWDKNKLGGLGDISIKRCNILNLFWEPGVDDIQLSKYFFEVDFQDENELKAAFPILKDQAIPKSVYTSKFRYDDHVDTENMVPVVNCYYKKSGILHYVLFCPGFVLYATENDTETPTIPVTDPLTGATVSISTGEKPMSERGIYDHGLYPYVFDALFPVEGSPCGYGFVDICKSPQTEIDMIKTAFVENTVVGATPRYFVTEGSGINEKDFTDLRKHVIKVSGGIIDNVVQPIQYNALPGNYVSVYEHTVQELRETSGNTETSTGNTTSGVTAASAIAALQEASGKGSRDANMSAYRAYSDICEIIIELIRQFYDMPRTFRIVGSTGREEFIPYSNAGLKPQMQYDATGAEIGYRKPVFDIRIVPQKRSAYTKMANNDLALQFYNMGFFNPQAADMALACLSIMDFDAKDELIKIVQRNGTMYESLMMMQQYALMLAAKYNDQMAMMQIQQLSAQLSGAQGAQTGGMTPMQQRTEPTMMTNARQRSRTAAMPTEGGVT